MNDRHIFMKFAIFGIFAVVMGKHIPSYAGPYRILIRTCHNVSEEYPNSTGRIWAHIYYSPAKPKQLQYNWGHIYFGIDFTDNLKVEVRMSQRAQNQWKRNAFVMRFSKPCSDALIHAKFMIKIIWDENTLRCPLQKVGHFTLKNRTIEPNFPHFPVMPYGRYLFTMGFFRGSENVGVLVVDGDVVPKL